MKKLFMVGCALSVLAYWPIAGHAEAPLPNDISIATPRAGLNNGLAAFLGRWFGSWNGNMDAVIIIEDITPNDAKILYAWSADPAWNIQEGYARYDGKVKVDEKITLSFISKSSSIFEITMNSGLSSLEVRRISRNGTLVETFKKVSP